MSDELRSDIENVELARAIASLMAEFHARGQRIRDLEEKLQAHKRSLESFHCVDEVALDDAMGEFRCEQKKDYSRQHMMRHAAERIGRKMLENGYIDFEEVVTRDNNYCRTMFKVTAHAYAVKPPRYQTAVEVMDAKVQERCAQCEDRATPCAMDLGGCKWRESSE